MTNQQPGNAEVIIGPTAEDLFGDLVVEPSSQIAVEPPSLESDIRNNPRITDKTAMDVFAEVREETEAEFAADEVLGDETPEDIISMAEEPGDESAGIEGLFDDEEFDELMVIGRRKDQRDVILNASAEELFGPIADEMELEPAYDEPASSSVDEPDHRPASPTFDEIRSETAGQVATDDVLGGETPDEIIERADDPIDEPELDPDLFDEEAFENLILPGRRKEGEFLWVETRDESTDVEADAFDEPDKSTVTTDASSETPVGQPSATDVPTETPDAMGSDVFGGSTSATPSDQRDIDTFAENVDDAVSASNARVTTTKDESLATTAQSLSNLRSQQTTDGGVVDHGDVGEFQETAAASAEQPPMHAQEPSDYGAPVDQQPEVEFEETEAHATPEVATTRVESEETPPRAEETGSTRTQPRSNSVDPVEENRDMSLFESVLAKLSK